MEALNSAICSCFLVKRHDHALKIERSVISSLEFWGCLSFAYPNQTTFLCAILLVYLNTLNRGKAGLHQFRFDNWTFDESLINVSSTAAFCVNTIDGPLVISSLIFLHKSYNFRKMGKIFQWLICADKNLPDLEACIQLSAYQFFSNDKTETFFCIASMVGKTSLLLYHCKNL